MACNKTDRQLLDFLSDDRLDPAVRTEMTRHLDSCSACRTKLEQYQATIDMVHHHPPAEPSPIAWRRYELGLNRRLTEPAKPPARRRLLWAAPILTAAVVLILLLVRVPETAVPDRHFAAIPENLSPEQVLAVADEIDQLLPEPEQASDEIILAEMADSEWWPDQDEVDSLVDSVNAYAGDVSDLYEEEWTEEQAELFIELYTETV